MSEKPIRSSNRSIPELVIAQILSVPESRGWTKENNEHCQRKDEDKNDGIAED